MQTTISTDGDIRLGQFLKLAGLAESGAHARELIQDGDVQVNGNTEVRRGHHLKVGDKVTVHNPDTVESAIVG